MNKELPFDDHVELTVRALYIGERLDLRAFESSSTYGVAPLAVVAGSHGVAVLFRYGVVVLFNVSPIEEAVLLKDLASLTPSPFKVPEVEDATLRIATDKVERGDNGIITLHRWDIERLQALSDVLAKSVVLAHYEDTIAQAFDGIESLAQDLTQNGSSRRSVRELLRLIGGTLLIQTQTVWRVEVGDKPEILWERPELELLYTRLVDEYELEERHLALERKLELISRTATTALELVHNKRSLRVEWYIVILIVIEIVISLYELLGHA
jgi:uncharacterized Rmd1/YagE family protein